jgi:hypothetical protein
MIGNIIDEYEAYPLSRYGMDSAFYWPRLWLIIDKDVRNEIDGEWAVVDAAVYTAAGAAFLAVL